MNFNSLIIIIFLLVTISSKSQPTLKTLKSKIATKTRNITSKMPANISQDETNRTLPLRDTTMPYPKRKDGEMSIESSIKQDSAIFQVYSKYDFVSGNDLLFADNFSDTEIGLFPISWNTNGKGETVILSSINSNKWLKMYQQNSYVPSSSYNLPDSYTIEFDLLMSMQNKGFLYPEIDFTLFKSPNNTFAEKSVFPKIRSEIAFQATLFPGENNRSYTLTKQFEKNKEISKTPPQSLKSIEHLYGKPTHFAISIQKERFRLWINEQKIYDLPRAIQTDFNNFSITIGSSNYADDQIGFYLGNFKIAGGLAEPASTLLLNRKIETTAITFGTNSAELQVTSMGIINEIGRLLLSKKDLKIRITGHTDSDGDNKFNKHLSERRAESVKQILMHTFNIEDSRIQISGKGEEYPIANNSTLAGKMKNRRVEIELL